MSEILVMKGDKLVGLCDCAKNQEKILIPNTVKEIADSAFRGNKAIKEIVFEENSTCERVGDSAFRDCENLESVELPESVKEVGELAFYNTKQTKYDRLYQKNISIKKHYAPKWTYEFLGKDVLPIGAYIEPSVGYFAENVTLDWNIREFVGSGCNIMICIGQIRWGTTNEHYHEIFKLLEKYGAMVMVKDDNEHVLINYDKAHEKGYASLAGWHVVDEPGTSSWVEGHNIYTRKGIEKTGKPELTSINKNASHKSFVDKYPRKLFYINLLPVNSPKHAFVLGAEDYCVEENRADLWKNYEKLAEYEYYYKTYMDDFKPEVFSYDFYPLWANGLGCDSHLFYPELNARHFEQLAVTRRYCQDYSLKIKGSETPFWNFIEVSGWGDSRSGARCPIHSEIEWQINTAFVFGSKGYQYFCYNQYCDITGGGAHNTITIETPVKYDGNINEDVYAMVRLANGRAQAFAKWILNASVDHIAQVGENPNNEVISAESFVPR
ncbi:MAG: leucine-rich repeat domain-containing protein, partial [Clostridia bacterium]|nr:leucine-rich repeat domain-containing protein [Clostridia bacterium]